MATYLSKSKYLSGLQCSKRLWLEIHDRAKATPKTIAQEQLIEQGKAVGLEAQTHFPGGHLIEIDPSNLDEAVAQTQAAMAKGASSIFEATFYAHNTYVIADIINKNKIGAWDIIEVKASSKVKTIHLHDLAIQKYILQEAGLAIAKTCLMHINRDCVYPNLNTLFTIADVSNKVDSLLDSISPNLQTFNALIQQKTQPDIPIGEHCSTPEKCPFKAYCWQDYEENTIFDIPQLSSKKKQDLQAKGITFLKALPPNYPLSDKQKAYVNRILNKKSFVDVKQIKAKLAQLKYPLYFFDFETDNAAIPRFKGVRPYQQIPFQYSCHIMAKDGSISHKDYLHQDETDPRLPLTQALIKDISPQGSLIAYNAGFEKMVLLALAKTFPQYASALKAMAERLWDQLDIFTHYYKLPAFGKSSSIKRVLPILVPTLNYKTLNVQRGDQAKTVWNQMIKSESGPSKHQMVNDLRAYCKMDTLAMVEIHRVLVAL